MVVWPWFDIKTPQQMEHPRHLMHGIYTYIEVAKRWVNVCIKMASPIYFGHQRRSLYTRIPQACNDLRCYLPRVVSTLSKTCKPTRPTVPSSLGCWANQRRRRDRPPGLAVDPCPSQVLLLEGQPRMRTDPLQDQDAGASAAPRAPACADSVRVRAAGSFLDRLEVDLKDV